MSSCNEPYRKPLSEIRKERVFRNEPIDASEPNIQPNEQMKRSLFRLWEIADRIVERLEEMRDANEPKPDEAWNAEFCHAVELLPEARQFAEECWWDYVGYK